MAQNNISFWINLNNTGPKESSEYEDEMVTVASIKKKNQDKGDTIVVHNNKKLDDEVTISASDTCKDNPVYIFKKFTVTVSYKILHENKFTPVSVPGKATFKDLIKLIFEMPDEFMEHISVKYHGKEVDNLDELVCMTRMTSLNKKYFISIKEKHVVTDLPEILAIMTKFTNNPGTLEGNLLKNHKKRLALNFLVPIFDHREGRVGDDVTLYYTGFQKFIDNADKIKSDDAPKSDDALLAHEMCQEMSKIFNNEPERSKKFNFLLEKFLGCSIKSSTIGQSMADLIIDPCQCVQVEVKNEMYGSVNESYSQIIAYYIQSLEEKKPELCPAPGYLLELVGPQLFISGAVFGQYVFVDRLVDPVWLVPQNEEAMIRIARIFKALKSAIEEIKKYYRPIAMDNSAIVKPRNPVFESFNEGKCRITYEERIKRHVFKGTLTRDDKPPVVVIIKFTKRYGCEAHDLMYRKGFAPKRIHYQERVEGTRYGAVVIKYIQDAKPLNTYLKKYPQNNDPEPYKEIMKKMHDGGYCHGKLTPNNIVIQLKDDNEYIYIVDYKWAGRRREAKFPFSADIPDGVQPGDLITPEQDMAQLQKIFRSTL